MTQDNPDLLQQHKQRFLEANQFLKTTKVNKDEKQTPLHQAPSFIVLGTPSSGKTSLLAQSEIPFHLARNDNLATTHDDINWWVCKQAIYLDLPPQYLDNPQGTFYQQFLSLIKKHSHNRQVRAIIIVIGLKEALTNDEQQQIKQIELLATSLQQTQRYFGKQIPLYLVINQMDWLTGFNEFFNAYAKDERQQPWGITLPTAKPALNKWLDIEFTDLINRLNQQVIWRLHHEPNLSKRTLIKDFPLQFSHSKEKLISYIINLNKACQQNFNLQGVYFCSALQNSSLDNTHESSSTQLAISKKNPSRPYFIHELLQAIIPATQPTKPPKWLTSSKLYATSFSVLVLAGIAGIGLFTANFAHQTQNYQQAEQSLANYQQLSQTPTTSDVEQLDKKLTNVAELGESSQALMGSDWQALMPGGLNDHELQQRLTKIYQQALTKLLLPNIKLTLETLLQSPNKIAPQYLYDALNAYIMLAQPEQFNKVQFNQTMQTIWQVTLPNRPKLQKLLTTQLQQALAKQQFTIRPNYQLIAQAKAVFNNLSPSEQGLALLESQPAYQHALTINLANNPNAARTLSLHNPNLGLPELYTINAWQQLTTGGFKKIALQLQQGNQIINPSRSLNFSQLQLQLEKLYLTQYAHHWLTLLNNVTLRLPNNMDELQNELTLLSSDNSPLLALANLLRQNIPAQALETSSQLSLFVNNFEPSQYQQIQQAISQLGTYLKPISSDQDAFALTKQRFLNQGRNDAISQLFSLAQRSENPIRYWLYQLANTSWKLLITSTQQWISTQWQQTIWFNYVNQIRDRYPFGNNTNNPASLASFINFFAPNGLLDQFFSNYISPFITIDQKPWHTLALNGQGVAFKTSLLNAFSASQNLQRNFFPNHDQNLSIPFMLKSLKYSVGLQSMSIKLGNQQVHFAPYQLSPTQALTWPDNQDSKSLTLQFINTDNQQQQIQLNNPWALWEVFNSSNFHPVANQTGQWVGLLQKGRDAIELELLSKSTQNPFDLEQFKAVRFNKELFI